MSVLLFCPLVASAAADSFDQYKTDSPPPGWTFGVTGGGAGQWSVEADASAPSHPHVLVQKGNARFAWGVYNSSALEDGTVETKLKVVAGSEDQAGGVIWRWKDANNYYIGRINALEDNVILFSMIDGKRRPMKTIDMKVTPKVWHSLKVHFVGSHISVFLDDKRVLDDDNLGLKGPGKVGLWTKADSLTSFDDFSFGKEK
jgi:hypothetical protein